MVVSFMDAVLVKFEGYTGHCPVHFALAVQLNLLFFSFDIKEHADFGPLGLQ
jgi:hypothetical protein